MLLFCLFIPAGGAAGLMVIRHYDPDCRFCRRDLLICATAVMAFGLLSVFSRQPAVLSLAAVMALLCACTVTDVLRCWLPAELTLPLCVAALWFISIFRPWALDNSLIWAGIWGGFYGLRYAYYRSRSGQERPGGGDIPLAAVAGLCGAELSGMVIALAITGHLLWGTLRHQHTGPLGPWLAAAIAIQLLYF